MVYRLFFNRALDWPQCWSIDEGDQTTEINVIDVRVLGCPMTTRVLPTPVRTLEGAAPVFPTAWLEIHGRLRVSRGVAVFEPECPSIHSSD